MRWVFFGGKGGVGKTTCAAAYAMRACEQGARVLAVSMDPAHSLADALATPLRASPTRIRAGRRVLHALELDADAALRRWAGEHEASLRTIAERGTYLDEQDVDRLFGLSTPGTDELVGLVELRRITRSGRWDTVIVDTAPTGHAMRLLQTPEALARFAQVLDEMQAKHRLLAESIAGRYRPDEADATILELAEEAASLRRMLADSDQCEARWVMLPEVLSIEETADALDELRALGLTVALLLVNRVTPRPSRDCPQCTPRVRAEVAAIAQTRRRFRGQPIALVAAAEEEPRGVAALRALGQQSTPARGAAPSQRRRSAASPATSAPPPFLLAPSPSRARRGSPPVVDWLGGRRLLLFGGKGGVGKTTCAAAAAIGLASASNRVLLLSTDPAHSISDVLGVPIGDDERPVPGVIGLSARELDARAAFEVERDRYRDAIDAMFRALVRSPRFDATYDRVVMEDLIDLAPPGIEEVFAVVTLIDALEPPSRRSRERPVWDTVVVDTAPTGHTLRLLAMPSVAREWAHALLSVLLKYRRVLGLGDLASDLLTFARRLRAFEELLHDPSRAAFVAVTRPAELPRLETERLLAALSRLRVPCPVVLADALTLGTCPRCLRAAAGESAHLAILATASHRHQASDRDRARPRTLGSQGGQRPRSSVPQGHAILVAPAVYPPPRGVRPLARWSARWAERKTGSRSPVTP